jgi:hypothetical protein
MICNYMELETKTQDREEQGAIVEEANDPPRIVMP